VAVGNNWVDEIHGVYKVPLEYFVNKLCEYTFSIKLYECTFQIHSNLRMPVADIQLD